MKTLSIIASLLMLSSVAVAIDVGEAFDDPKLQARYEKIISEVRCLKCQNQTIKDSNAFLASDLRREIRHMLEDGKTNDEIYEFLVSRYGDFALYRPRASCRTLILWFAPMMFLVFGAFALWRIVQRRTVLSIDDEAIDDV